MNRVVVTGLGCVTPIGNSVEEFRDALYAGRTGIMDLDPAFPGALSADPGLKFHTIARVRNFDPSSHLTTGTLTVTGPGAQFAIVAARQAVQESCILEHYTPEEIGIVTGCSCGGREADEDACRVLYTRNGRVPPTAILRTMANSGTSNIAIDLGIQGPVFNVATACASGTHALGLAFHMVRSGMVPAAITGGYEAPLTFAFLRAWDSMRVVSPTSCRPFSADRDGMTLGEGAAMLVLESLKAAQSRKAHIYAELVGFGMSADAHHVTQPRAEGAALAMTRALSDSAATGIENPAGRVGYINAHGTGTPSNDKVEAAAIQQALGPEAVHAAVSATKSLHGHSIGAVGSIEALVTILALDRALLPFTAGTMDVDSGINLDVITEAPRAMVPGRDIALSNSLAFGGLNAVVALRRFQD